MAGNIFQDVHAAEGFQVGKEGGGSALAERTDFLDCIVAEYVWLDSNGQTRSKCKTVDKKPASSDDCAIWAYNGVQCGQAEATNSDVYLVPRKVFDDPIRGAPHVLVICESITAAMEPAVGNFRAECSEYLERYQKHDWWFGMEQEYVRCNDEGDALYAHGPDFYCGRGAMHLPENMREVMGDHYACCLRAGIKICGMNCEAGMAQGEFQIGPCKGINAGDHLIAARHTLHKCAQKYRIAISFKATNENVEGGSSLQTNISTTLTRADGGLTVIENLAKRMAQTHNDAMKEFGEGNVERMSGRWNTPDMNSFRFGVGDRTTSVRIPRGVGIVGKGYLEDRRPAANADPYRIMMHHMKALGPMLDRQAGASLL